MMRVLVTGASGMIGCQVIKALHWQGYDVVATGLPVKRSVNKTTRSNEARKIRGVAELPKIRNIDLLDAKSTRPLMRGVQAVVHLANAHNWAQQSLSLGLIENMKMHINVFEEAALAGVGMMIFASSVHVFNAMKPDATLASDYQTPYLPFDGATPACPVNPYGMSKQFCETVLSELHTRTGMTTVALRLPLVADRAKLRAIQSGKIKPYAGAVNTGFAYLSINDTVSLVSALLASPLRGHRVYFPASAHNMLARPAAEVIASYYQSVPLRRRATQIDSLVDISAITRETGWAPTQ